MTTARDCLLVIPERMSITPFSGCPPADPTRGASIAPQAPVGGKLDFEVLGRGVVSSPSRTNQQTPTAALYAPKPFLDLRFTELVPALNHTDEGTGFIGHVLRVSVEIRHISLAIESGALKLIVALGMWARATLNIDVPCVGRKEFASLEVKLPEHGDADISVNLRLGVDSSARVLLTSEVAGIDLGKAKVDLNLFGTIGTPLVTVTTYVTDFLIGRIIQNNIPWMVFDRVKAALDDKFFVIADLKDYLPFLESPPNSAMYSGSADSALLGLNYSG